MSDILRRDDLWYAELWYGEPCLNRRAYNSPEMPFWKLHTWIAEMYELDLNIAVIHLTRVEESEEQ
jgi:hypothetical protein